MNKQMKSAYTSLRLKDSLMAMLYWPKWCIVALSVGVLGFFSIETAAILWGEMIVMFATIKILIGICNKRMERNGYTEVELERLALA